MDGHCTSNGLYDSEISVREGEREERERERGERERIGCPALVSL